MQQNDYDNTIYATAVAYGMTDAFARLLVCQAREESGNYSDGAFLNGWNAWGMDYSDYNPEAEESDTDFNADNPAAPVPYAKYDDLGDASIAQCMYYTNEFGPGGYDVSQMQTPEGYVGQLQANGYFAESAAQYLADMQALYGQVKGWDFSAPAPAQPAGAWLLAAGCAAALFIVLKFKRKQGFMQG